MGINPQGVSVKAVQKILKVISGLFPDKTEIKPDRHNKRYPCCGNSQYCGGIHQTEKKKYRRHDPGKASPRTLKLRDILNCDAGTC